MKSGAHGAHTPCGIVLAFARMLARGLPLSWPTTQTRRFGWLLVLCLGSFAAVALVTLGEWYRGVIALQEPPARAELAGAANGLRTLIWTDREGVGSSDTVRLWVLCDNQTGADVQDLHFLSFETPGFEKLNGAHCWQGNQPVCSLGKDGEPQITGLPRLLTNGRAAAVYAELRPRRSFGRHGASGILVWKAQARDFQRAVILPGLGFHSELLDWTSGFLKAVELCSLPVILAFLALMLKKRDDVREASARDERIWQVRLQETWNLQFPRIYKSITRYYMPLMAVIEELLPQSKKLNLLSKKGELQRGLYRLLLFSRRMTEVSANIGGFFLKDLEGEEMAAACLNLFEKARRKQMLKVDEDMALILDVIHPRISLAQFMDLVRGGGAPGDSRITASLTKLTNSLKDWIIGGTFSEDLVPLEILLDILAFEINRPAELWYERLPPFPTASFRQAVNRLPEATCRELKTKLEAYRANCEEAVRKSRQYWLRAVKPFDGTPITVIDGRLARP